jgi:hypothetical protein
LLGNNQEIRYLLVAAVGSAGANAGHGIVQEYKM